MNGPMDQHYREDDGWPQEQDPPDPDGDAFDAWADEHEEAYPHDDEG